MLIRILLITCITFSYSLSAMASKPANVIIETPPASIAEWYKPANKRQAWLHTMFRLRRSMQAVEEYAQSGNKPGMEKWAEKLEEDYEKIGEMVPEWEDEVKPALMKMLTKFIDKGDTKRVNKTLRMINKTCVDCHSNHQAQVAAIYRAPSYDDIKVKINHKDVSFSDSMKELSKSVNRILIALEDDDYNTALHSRTTLSTQLVSLEKSCASCHKEKAPYEHILGTETNNKLAQLESHLKNKNIKESRKVMGDFAVSVCARCHSTHRTLSDLRKVLLNE